MRETPRRTWIRWAAATMVIAAGAVDVAQVRVRTDEDPLFGLFFIVVAAPQLAGGAYLARPIAPARVFRAMFAFGIAVSSRQSRWRTPLATAQLLGGAGHGCLDGRSIDGVVTNGPGGSAPSGGGLRPSGWMPTAVGRGAFCSGRSLTIALGQT